MFFTGTPKWKVEGKLTFGWTPVPPVWTERGFMVLSAALLVTNLGRADRDRVTFKRKKRKARPLGQLLPLRNIIRLTPRARRERERRDFSYLRGSACVSLSLFCSREPPMTGPCQATFPLVDLGSY